MSLLHHQPFKMLYVAYFLVKILCVKIPYWTLISLPRSRRPRPSWSIGRCLRIYTLRATLTFPINLGELQKRDPNMEVANSTLRNAKFGWVDGIQNEVMTGEIKMFAEKAGVKPTRIPGYWQLKKDSWTEWTPKAKEEEKVVYHLHGGGFSAGSAHPSDITALIPRGILEHSTIVTRTFAIDYRISASAPFPAENPFPAALLDAIAGYQYLVNQGFHSENIIVAGDSAGGNLALALIRYLKESRPQELKIPGKLLLLSLWGDLFFSSNGPTSSIVKNMTSDMLPVMPVGMEGFGGYAAKSYIGTALNHEDVKTNIYLCPTSEHLVDLKGAFDQFPKTYVLAGGAERILDDSKIISDRIRADNANREDWVTLDVVDDAVHDFCALAWHEPERTEALKRVSRWIDKE